MDKEKVKTALKKCLLTDKEMKMGPKGWAAMEDPYKEAWDKAEEEDHGHDHSHHGHDHSHPHGHHH